MIRFIQTQNGSFVAGSEIVKITETGKSISTITTRNGQHFQVEDYASTIVSIIEESLQVIPASCGYNAIPRIFSAKDEKWTYELRPIIGWLRHPQAIHDQDENNVGYPNAMGSIPIVSGHVANQYEWNIVLPDGRVIEVFRMHASIQEWFDCKGGEGSKRKSNKKKGAPSINDVDDLLMDGVIEKVLESEDDKSKKATNKNARVEQ